MNQLVSDGFQVALQVLSRDDVLSLRSAITDTIDAVARALRAPFETSCPAASFEERLDRVAATDRAYATVLFRAVLADAHRDPRMQALAIHPALTALITDLIHPFRWSGHVLRPRAVVPAFAAARSPWHQDVVRETTTGCGAVRFACWIPLSRVTEQRGALEVIPGAWRAPLAHREQDGDFSILEDQLPPDRQTVPVDCGDVVILDGLSLTGRCRSRVSGHGGPWSCGSRENEETANETHDLDRHRSFVCNPRIRPDGPSGSRPL